MAEKNEVDRASVAYVLGILSIVLAFTTLYALGGIITGIIGIVQSKGLKKIRRLSVIGLVLSIIFFILILLLYSINPGVYSSGSFPRF